MARTSPLRGSMTMQTAALAPELRTALVSTSSAVYWISSSMVRRTSAPETGCVWRTVRRVWPAGSRTTTSLPAWPLSSLSYCSSRPAMPLLSTSVAPMTCAADPFMGYIRASSAYAPTPGRSRASAALASSGSTLRAT